MIFETIVSVASLFFAAFVLFSFVRFALIPELSKVKQ